MITIWTRITPSILSWPRTALLPFLSIYEGKTSWHLNDGCDVLWCWSSNCSIYPNRIYKYVSLIKSVSARKESNLYPALEHSSPSPLFTPKKEPKILICSGNSIFLDPLRIHSTGQSSVSQTRFKHVLKDAQPEASVTRLLQLTSQAPSQLNFSGKTH